LKRSTAEKSARALAVGQVAQRAGVSIATLHFYEWKGLVDSWRNSGNQRGYSREVLRRIAVIRVAQRTGLSLKVIKEALSLLPAGRVPSAEDRKQLSKSWRGELEDRIQRLTGLRDQLDGLSAAAAFLSKSARCGILGTFLRNRDPALDCSIAQEARIQGRGRRRKRLGLHRNAGWLLIKNAQ
jgi:MerR family transcriptional regulator, redox-sensitive transcriptional activator SoxR